MASETKSRSPQKSPDFELYRVISEAPDTLPETDSRHGVNMGNYRRALIDVAPESGANPNILVLWWSEKAQAFVQDNPSILKSGVGINVAYQFEVECHGRIMFVAAVAGVAAGHTVTISVAGFELDHTL